MSRLRVLICAGPYSLRPQAMSGSGLRLLQLAAGLGPWCDIELLLDDGNPTAPEDVRLDVATEAEDALARANVLYTFDDHADGLLQRAAARGCIVVCENHTPIEHAYYRRAADGPDPHARAVQRYRDQLQIADLFVVRSEPERCSVIDGLVLSGRVTSADVVADVSLESRVMLVPVGVLKAELEALPPGARDEPPPTGGIWWNGGLWEFHDPLALVAAVAEAAAAGRRIDVTFPYVPAPSESPLLRRLTAAIQSDGVADRVRLLDEHPDHRTRDAQIARARAFACLGRESAENVLCHRLRLRDTYLYRRPFVADAHGATGALVAATGIGLALDRRDPKAAAGELVALLAHGDRWRACADAIDRLLPTVLLDVHCERLASAMEELARRPDRTRSR